MEDERIESDGLRLWAHTGRPSGGGAGAAAGPRPRPWVPDRSALVRVARARPIRSSPTGWRPTPAGWCSPSTSGERASPRATSRWAAGCATCRPPSTTSRADRASTACGWPASGTGGSLAVCAAARGRPRSAAWRRSAAPADFDDWAADPRRFLQTARDLGVVRDAGFPADVAGVGPELEETRAIGCVDQLAPRPLMIVHGSIDDVVPVLRRPGARRRGRDRRAAHHHRRRPPAAARPAGGRGAARLARPPVLSVLAARASPKVGAIAAGTDRSSARSALAWPVGSSASVR